MLDVAVKVLPYERLALRPFVLEWALSAEDGTAFGGPEDVSDVTAVRVSAQLQVPVGGTPPAATVWALGSGVTWSTASVDGATRPVLVVTEPTGLPAGTYDVLVSLTRGGLADWVLIATLKLTPQP